jgi:hypothetical protein
MLQGLKRWVPLAAVGSSSASPVAAVQLSVQLTELGSLCLASSSADDGGGGLREPLLLRSAAATALVPPQLRAPLLLPPGHGFGGQPAVLSIQLDTLLPLSSASGGRAKAHRYVCRYSLPGSEVEASSAPRVLTAVGSGSAVPRRSNSSKDGSRGLSSRAGLAQPTWGVKLNHRGFFEVW